MTLTQKFIREKSLSELCERYAIAAKRHGKHPNLVMLKYSQIDSPMGDPIVQECRGLILDEANDWRIVSYPFRKFFNHGEGHAATIDWATARVYEKLDGSLTTLYWYDGAWQVASSGLPDASGDINGRSMTFAELFWKTWEAMGYKLPPEPEQDDEPPCCYMFELTTPLNRVVVPHKDSRLTLTGVRDLNDLTEYRVDGCAKSIGWRCVKSFSLDSFDACIAAAQSIDPMQAEGYVVCDATFNRVKVKAPAYVALAHLKDGMSGRRLLDVVRANESSEFLAYFPEWSDAYGVLRRAFDELCDGLESTYEQIKGIPEQKPFALEAIKTRCSSALFSIRKGSVKTAREYFANCTPASIERCIGVELANLMPAMTTEAAS